VRAELVQRGGAWRRQRTPVDDGGRWQVLEHRRDEASEEEPKKKGGKSQSMELTVRRQWRWGRLHNPARDGGSSAGERTHGFGKSRGGDGLLRRESAYAKKGGERWGIGGPFWTEQRGEGSVGLAGARGREGGAGVRFEGVHMEGGGGPSGRQDARPAKWSAWWPQGGNRGGARVGLSGKIRKEKWVGPME
jgi:hypothetical protein